MAIKGTKNAHVSSKCMSQTIWRCGVHVRMRKIGRNPHFENQRVLLQLMLINYWYSLSSILEIYSSTLGYKLGIASKIWHTLLLHIWRLLMKMLTSFGKSKSGNTGVKPLSLSTRHDFPVPTPRRCCCSLLCYCSNQLTSFVQRNLT